MGTFRSLFILAVGAAIGGAALITYRISQDTGKPLAEAIPDVPAEARRLFSDVRDRATQAIERGRDMYLEKQEEIADQLRGNVEAER